MSCNKCNRDSGYIDWHCCVCVSPNWVKCDSCETRHHCSHVCYKSNIIKRKDKRI